MNIGTIMEESLLTLSDSRILIHFLLVWVLSLVFCWKVFPLLFSKEEVPIPQDKVEEHKLESRLECLAGLCVRYPVAEDVQQELEKLDQQTKELQVHCERKCRHIYRPELEFSGPVQYWNFRRRCYSDLLRRHTVGVNNTSNIVRRCHRAGIEDPKQLTAEQCREGKRYCCMRMREFKKVSPWMRKQLLEARKQVAWAEGRHDDCAGIARVE